MWRAEAHLHGVGCGAREPEQQVPGMAVEEQAAVGGVGVQQARQHTQGRGLQTEGVGGGGEEGEAEMEGGREGGSCVCETRGFP